MNQTSVRIICDHIILHNMIIDDERDDGYDDNYHTITSVVALPVTYEAPASLITIIQREAHLTFRLIFLNLQSDLSMCGTSFTSLMYLSI
jgi:hypothetical protein